MRKLSSKLIHGIIENQKDVFRSLKTPVYDSSAFYFENSQQIADSFAGKIDTFAYSRTANPTVAELESRLTILSGATATLCTSSGMFAITSTLLSLCSKGDHIVASPFLFGHTYSLLDSTFKDFGIETSFVDFRDITSIENAITNKTRVIYLENIANPQLIVFDIEAISKIAKEKNIILVVDNTLLTPYLFSSKDMGVDVEVISTTKAISGGATSVGGAIFVYESEKWQHNPKLKGFYDSFGKFALVKKLRKEIYRNMGGNMTAHNAYLQLLGLETLTLRIDKSSHNALELSQFLKTNKNVLKVTYPGLKDSEYQHLLNSQYKGRSGCVINFELANQQACFAFMDALKMIRRATNLCDNKSLIIHPYSTIYTEFSSEQKEFLLINERMIRLSVGIEDIQDIIDDISQALDIMNSKQ